jgi:hypothetical protein
MPIVMENTLIVNFALPFFDVKAAGAFYYTRGTIGTCDGVILMDSRFLTAAARSRQPFLGQIQMSFLTEMQLLWLFFFD